MGGQLGGEEFDGLVRNVSLSLGACNLDCHLCLFWGLSCLSFSSLKEPTEHMLVKLADFPRLEKMVDMLKNRAVVHGDQRLGRTANKILMEKILMKKRWMPSPEFGIKSPWHQYELGTDGFGSGCAEKTLKVLVHSELCMSHQCTVTAKKARSIEGWLDRAQPVA